jgi:hypothetical protein
VRRRNGVVQRFRLRVEAELLAAQHRRARAQRLELPRQVLMPEPHELLGTCHRLCRIERGQHVRRLAVDVGNLAPRRLSLLSPHRRPVVGVHVIGVVLTQSEYEFDVSLR